MEEFFLRLRTTTSEVPWPLLSRLNSQSEKRSRAFCRRFTDEAFTVMLSKSSSNWLKSLSFSSQSGRESRMDGVAPVGGLLWGGSLLFNGGSTLDPLLDGRWRLSRRNISSVGVSAQYRPGSCSVGEAEVGGVLKVGSSSWVSEGVAVGALPMPGPSSSFRVSSDELSARLSLLRRSSEKIFSNSSTSSRRNDFGRSTGCEDSAPSLTAESSSRVAPEGRGSPERSAMA